jgi:drug/metabolite transporter (DMT)-like permease
LALGPQVVGWMALGYALPRLAATVTSFAILLQPTLTMVWGRALFDERAGAVQLIGVALVLAGIGAVTWRRSPTPDPSQH